MTLARLCSRLAKLETQRRPAHVTAVLRRVRACAPADLRAVLVIELSAVDRVTRDAILEQLADALTDAEVEALVGPDTIRLMKTLSATELAPLARGDPAATRRFQRALRALQHQGDACP